MCGCLVVVVVLEVLPDHDTMKDLSTGSEGTNSNLGLVITTTPEAAIPNEAIIVDERTSTHDRRYAGVVDWIEELATLFRQLQWEKFGSISVKVYHER